jgi:hypothetical protein
VMDKGSPGCFSLKCTYEVTGIRCS